MPDALWLGAPRVDPTRSCDLPAHLKWFHHHENPSSRRINEGDTPNSPNHERSPNHSQRVSHRGSRHQGALSNRSQQQRPFLPRARQRRNGSAPVASARRLVVIMGRLKLDALLPYPLWSGTSDTNQASGCSARCHHFLHPPANRRYCSYRFSETEPRSVPPLLMIALPCFVRSSMCKARRSPTWRYLSNIYEAIV